EYRLDRREVACRGHDDAAGTHHRLGDHGGYRIRTLALDQVAQGLHHACGEFFFALAVLAEAVVVWAVGVEHAVDRQIPTDVVVRQARQRGRHDGHAVIGLGARDDLLLVRLAARIVEVPGQLD